MTDHAQHLAINFAADVDPDAYQDRMTTDEFIDLAERIGAEADRRREAAQAADKDFYSGAFVERAATMFNECADATFDELCDCGQRESDEIAG